MFSKSTIVKYIEKFHGKMKSSYFRKTNLYIIYNKLSFTFAIYLIFNKFRNKLKGTFVDSKFTFEVLIRE